MEGGGKEKDKLEVYHYIGWREKGANSGTTVFQINDQRVCFWARKEGRCGFGHLFKLGN